MTNEWLDDSPSCIQVTAVGVVFGAALLVGGGLVGGRKRQTAFQALNDLHIDRAVSVVCGLRNPVVQVIGKPKADGHTLFRGSLRLLVGSHIRIVHHA